MKKILLLMISFGIGVLSAFVVIKNFFEKPLNENTILPRYKKYYNVLNQWIYKIHQEGSIENYFQKNNFQKVAIYGMGELGERLSEEIKHMESVTLEYAIDSEPDKIFAEIPIYRKEDFFPDVDVIVVTPVFAYDVIETDLSKKTDIKIVSLEEVVFE